MRIKRGCNLRTIAGESIVLMNTAHGMDATKVLSLNPSSAWLWEQVVDRDFTIEEAVELLLERYDVTREVAERDVSRWIALLLEHGVCE